MQKELSEYLEETTFPEKNKTRGTRRKKDVKKALRKQKISREVYDHEWYKNLHEYTKNKIHCSCPVCSGADKTNIKKLRTKGYGKKDNKTVMKFGTTNHRKGKNWSASDIRKLEGMDPELD